MKTNHSLLIFILKIWIVNHNLILTESNEVQDAPIIESPDTITIDVNEGKTIECKAKTSITWTSERLQDSTKISHFEDDQGFYHSQLELSSVQISFVGFYYCVFNSSIDANFNYEDKIKSREASSLYIYVNDPENKLFNSDQYIIFGKQNESLVIPCKPTSPDVKVELVSDGDEGHDVGQFDPKVGYTVSFMGDEESGFFECRLADDHEIYNEFQVIINSQDESDVFIKPLVISDSQNIAKNGASFSLSCHVETISDAPYVIEFFLPNGSKAKSTEYLTLSATKVDDNDSRKASKNLTIVNALDSRDQGNYTCSLKDIYNNIYSTVTKITFVDKPVVQLNSSNPIVSTSSGKKSIKFHFNYFVYPKAKFEWYDPYNKLISYNQSMEKDEKYIVTVSDDEISLTIKSPGIEDFGNYTLVAYTDGERYEKKVKLIVSDKPKCKLHDEYSMKGTDVYMNCECLSYPEAEIEWSFKPCLNLTLWPQCPEVDIDELKVDKYEIVTTKDAEYIQSTKIKLTASQPGIVICLAKNSVGEEKVEGKLQVVDLKEPFLLSGIDENKTVAVGDEITLECGAIIYNYTDTISWLKNGKPVEMKNDVQIIDSSTQFSYRKTLKFNSMIKEDEGEYTCEVHDKDTNEVHIQITSVTLRENEPPKISANFQQENLTESYGNRLTLKCIVSGFPTPSLIWFKDGNPIEINDTRISLKDKNMTLMFTDLKLEDSGFYECNAENSFGKESKAVEINVKMSEFPCDMNLVIVIGGVIALIFVLSCIICLYCKCKKKS